MAARLLYPIPLAALGYFPCEGKEEVGSFFASAASCLCFSLEGEVPSLRGDGGVAAGLLYPIPLAALGYFPCEGKEEVGSFFASAASFLCFPLEGEVPSLRGDGGVAARLLYPIPLAALGYFPCEGKEEVGSFFASATSCLCFSLEGEVPSLRGDGGVAARLLYPIPLAALGYFPCEGKQEVGSFLASATSCLCFPLQGEVPSLRGDGGVAARILYPIPLAALGHFPCEEEGGGQLKFSRRVVDEACEVLEGRGGVRGSTVTVGP